MTDSIKFNINTCTINDYVQYCWDQARTYVYGISNGSIKANEYIMGAIQRHQDDLKRTDLIYDISKVEKVFRFFYYINVDHPFDESGYHRINLMPWQCFAIMSIFGFYLKNNPTIRRFQQAFIFLGRKNCKSTFAAILSLYALTKDGVTDPQIIYAANLSDQSKVPLILASGIIYNSPALLRRLEPQRYAIIFRDRKKIGFIKTTSGMGKEDTGKKDGTGPSFAIIDEAHGMSNHDMLQVIKDGTDHRLNSLIFIISSAGTKPSCLAADMLDAGKRVLQGKAEDDKTFYLLYTLPENADYHDENNWIYSNPVLGVGLHMDKLREAYNQTKLHPSKLIKFLTKRMNIFVTETIDWLPVEKLKKCFQEKINWDEFKGQKCFAAIDLSATRDLSAVTYTFKKNGKFFSKTQFYWPELPEKRIRKGNIDLLPWIKADIIKVCHGGIIDYDMIANDIITFSKEYSITKVYYDSYQSKSIILKLQAAGIITEVFKQNAMNFNAPIKMLELNIINENIKMDINPCLLWNFYNVALWADNVNGNTRFAKNRSRDSIDGAVTVAMTMKGFDEEINIQIPVGLFSN